MVKNTIKPNHKLNSLLKYTTAITMSISVGKMLKEENKNQVRKIQYYGIVYTTQNVTSVPKISIPSATDVIIYLKIIYSN